MVFRLIFSGYVAVFSLTLTTFSSEAVAAELKKGLEPTINRYFSANKAYRPGDLISKSQLEELQVYLRRTQGNSLATHPKWLGRTLSDRNALVQSFNTNGAPFLRQAATELGGYADLDRMARNALGRKELQEAIASKSPEILIRRLKSEREVTAAKPSNQDSKQPPTPRSDRIYTAADFLAALAGPVQGARLSKDSTSFAGDARTP